MTERLHPVQVEMLRLEAQFDCRPLDQAIAELTGLAAEGDELAEMLAVEVDRALGMTVGHYSEFVDPTPYVVAAIGFLHGVTFATAARNLANGSGGAIRHTAAKAAPNPTQGGR